MSSWHSWKILSRFSGADQTPVWYSETHNERDGLLTPEGAPNGSDRAKDHVGTDLRVRSCRLIAEEDYGYHRRKH